MHLDYQIAQKLHGVTGGDRVRDLIDIQLIARQDELDLSRIRQVCRRLFAYRQEQPWPPIVVPRKDWDTAYGIQAQGLPVIKNLDDAIAWANDLIARIDAAA